MGNDILHYLKTAYPVLGWIDQYSDRKAHWYNNQADNNQADNFHIYYTNEPGYFNWSGNKPPKYRPFYIFFMDTKNYFRKFKWYLLSKYKKG